MSTDIVWLDASTAVSEFSNGTLSPVELMQATIERASAVESEVNAFTDTYFDDALTQAAAAQRRYRDGTARPLEGIPCVIKDEIQVAGMRNTGGSLIYKDRIATETDVIAERLINAGAIVHARTATPEFCLLSTTQSRIHGVTRNPYNRDMTPGGSSGGTGASLAAGTTTLGTGTDIAGSIRIPAGCTGTVGLKASYGRIPEMTPFNLDFYSHSGPMTRSVADSRLMLETVAGVSPRDIASLRDRLDLPTEPAEISGWKIAWSMDLGFFEVADDVRRNTMKVLEHLNDLGCTLEEVEFPWDESCEKAVGDYLNVLWGQHMRRLTDEHRELMTDYAIRAALESEISDTEDLLASLEKAAEVYAQFSPTLERHNLFVCPTNALTAVPADQDPWDDNFVINGRRVSPEYGWIMTHPFNMLSRCPVLSMPSGLGDNGVPTGVQLVGKTYDEPSIYRAAAAIEPAFGFTPPDI